MPGAGIQTHSAGEAKIPNRGPALGHRRAEEIRQRCLPPGGSGRPRVRGFNSQSSLSLVGGSQRGGRAGGQPPQALPAPHGPTWAGCAPSTEPMGGSAPRSATSVRSMQCFALPRSDSPEPRPGYHREKLRERRLRAEPSVLPPAVPRGAVLARSAPAPLGTRRLSGITCNPSVFSPFFSFRHLGTVRRTAPGWLHALLPGRRCA